MFVTRCAGIVSPLHHRKIKSSTAGGTGQACRRAVTLQVFLRYALADHCIQRDNVREIPPCDKPAQSVSKARADVGFSGTTRLLGGSLLSKTTRVRLVPGWQGHQCPKVFRHKKRMLTTSSYITQTRLNKPLHPRGKRRRASLTNVFYAKCAHTTQISRPWKSSWPRC